MILSWFEIIPFLNVKTDFFNPRTKKRKSEVFIYIFVGKKSIKEAIEKQR